MPLSQKSGFKANLVSFWRPNREEKKRKRRRRRRRRRRGEAQANQSKGMETEFIHGFYEIMHEFPCFVGYPLAQI